jgi:hypothetical protein
MMIALMLLSPPTFAASTPVTETTHQHNVVANYVDVLPACSGDGPLYSFTTLSNIVRHITEFPDGRVTVTVAQTSRFVAEPVDDADAPSYSGRFTMSGPFIRDDKTTSSSYVYSYTGTGSDGSKLRVNYVEHLLELPDGTVTLSSRCR